MGRQPKGTPTGRASAFQDEKLGWLLGFENDWRTTDRKTFYDMMPKRYFARYGYDVPFEENVPDIATWVPRDRKLGLTPDELVIENDFQERQYTKLRTKLANWFRNRFKGKRLHTAALKSIMKAMHAMTSAGTRPRRKTNLAFYSSKYYAAKMKADFDAVWEGAKEALPSSARISMCQDFVKSRLAGETEEFKEQLAEEAGAEHAAAMKKFKEDHTAPERSAEQYHEALESFDEVGIPLADALSERMGAHIIIFAVGPVGSQKGEVRLRTIFSDTGAGQINKVWGEFDRPTFTAAEESLTRWGRAFFSRQECRDRAWPPVEMAPADPGWGELLRMPDEGGGTTAAPLIPQVPAPSLPQVPMTVPIATASVQAVPVPQAPIGGESASGAPSSPVTDSPVAPGDETPAMDSGDDRHRWSQTQMDVCDLMSSKKWGARWEKLIEAVVKFEESVLWAQGKLPRSSVRPTEIAAWMKARRKAGDYTDAKNWKENFGERLVAWWRSLGPEWRQIERPEDVPDNKPWPERGNVQDPTNFRWTDWTCVRHGGDNGMLLVVQALTWWGQEIFNEGSRNGLGGGEAALAENEGWQELMEDVMWVYGQITDPLDDDTREELAAERRGRRPAQAVEEQSGEERRGGIAGDDDDDICRREEELERERERTRDLALANPIPGGGGARFLAMRQRTADALEASAEAKVRLQAAAEAARKETAEKRQQVAKEKQKSAADKGKGKRKRTEEEEGEGDVPNHADAPPRRKTRSSGAVVQSETAKRAKPKPAWRGAEKNVTAPADTAAPDDSMGATGAGADVGTSSTATETPDDPVGNEGGGVHGAAGDETVSAHTAGDVHMDDVVSPEPPVVPFGRKGLLVEGGDGRLRRAAAAPEMTVSSSSTPAPAATPVATDEDPFSPEYLDPFAKDAFAGLTPEERADLEAEMALDADANDDEDDEEEEEEEEV